MSPSAKFICIGGLTGSGKTTVADQIAEQMNKQGQKTIVLDSDRIRKELWGVSETTRLPDEAYVWDVTEQVIFETENRIKEAIKNDINVIQCAMLTTELTREKTAEFAKQNKLPFQGVFIHCETDVLKERIAQRATKNDNASDAGIDILEKMLTTYEKPNSWIIVNGAQKLDDVVKETKEKLEISDPVSNQPAQKKTMTSRFKR